MDIPELIRFCKGLTVLGSPLHDVEWVLTEYDAYLRWKSFRQKSFYQHLLDESCERGLNLIASNLFTEDWEMSDDGLTVNGLSAKEITDLIIAESPNWKLPMYPMNLDIRSQYWKVYYINWTQQDFKKVVEKHLIGLHLPWYNWLGEEYCLSDLRGIDATAIHFCMECEDRYAAR